MRRMKKLGLDEKTISGFWKAEGRVHLEAASVVWGSSLTVHQAQQLQRVEHRTVAALSEKMENPKISCQRLDVRRQNWPSNLQKERLRSPDMATYSQS